MESKIISDDVVFPNIVNWLKTKVLNNPKFIECLIGAGNYNNIKSTLPSTATEVELADVLMSGLNIIAQASERETDRKIATCLIKEIKDRYELERNDHIKNAIAKKSFAENINKNVENYMRLLECGPEEFIQAIASGFNTTENERIANAKFNDFKKIIYAKFAEIENMPHKTDDHYITTIINERKIAIQSMLDEIDINQAQSVSSESIIVQRLSLKREFELTMCPICYVEYKDTDKIELLQCGHSFHPSCIRKWFLKQKSCPACRS